MKKKIILTALCICVLGLIFSGYCLFSWKADSDNIDKQINLINKAIDIREVEDSENTNNFNPPKEKADPYWDFIKTSLIEVDFTALKKINPDTEGWLQVRGTNINYPFVRNADNDYYLTHSFNKSRNKAGWIFLDYRNSLDSFGENTVIYAHSRVGGKMFGTLKNAISNDWYQNSINHIVKISTEESNTLWQVFSVYRIKTTNDYLQTSFSSALQYQNFLNLIKSRSVYDFDTVLNSEDKILTLSTCHGETEKTVLHAKLIKISPK